MMPNLEILNELTLGDNFEQMQKFRDIPMTVIQIVNRIADSFLLGKLEPAVERAAGCDYLKRLRTPFLKVLHYGAASNGFKFKYLKICREYTLQTHSEQNMYS